MHNPTLHIVKPLKRKIMEVRIQIADSVYAELLNGNKRIKGTIGLVSPKVGNFNAWRKSQAQPTVQYMKLPHGKVGVNDTHVYLTMKMGVSERQSPAFIIQEESRIASNFVNLMEEIA